jgi:branched-chain amino acid transport system substrate-binding protein
MRGAHLVFNEINKKGGIHGRKIVVVEEDSACAPNKAVSAAKKLIYQHKVFAFLAGACSSATNATKPMMKQENVPLVVLAAAGDAVTTPVSRQIYGLCPSNETQGGAGVEFAIKELKAKRLAIIRQADDWGNYGLQGAAKWLKGRYGMELVAVESALRDANDVSAQVLRIKAANPDTVLTYLYQRVASIFLRQAHELGLKANFIGLAGTAANLPLLRKEVGIPEAMENFYFSNIFKDNLDPYGPKFDKWIKLYKHYYPDLAKKEGYPKSLMLQGVASGHVFIVALERAGKDLTRDKFLDALETIRDMDSWAYMTNITFRPDDHQGGKGTSFQKYTTTESVHYNKFYRGRH